MKDYQLAYAQQLEQEHKINNDLFASTEVDPPYRVHDVIEVVNKRLSNQDTVVKIEGRNFLSFSRYTVDGRLKHFEEPLEQDKPRLRTYIED